MGFPRWGGPRGKGGGKSMGGGRREGRQWDYQGRGATVGSGIPKMGGNPGIKWWASLWETGEERVGSKVR